MSREVENIKHYRVHIDKYYVSPYKDGWTVRYEESSLIAYNYKDKDKALITAKYLAEEHHGDLVIQKPDGTIQETLSYHK